MPNADNFINNLCIVMKSGNSNFLEPSGTIQACNGTDLPLRLHKPSCRRPDVRCSQVEHVVRGEEKISISDSNVFLFIKSFIDLRLVLQALYYPAELQISNRDTF